MMINRTHLRSIALGLLLTGGVFGQSRGNLTVKVLEGDGAFNDIKHKVGHPVGVEVRDENNRVVSGAEVTFAAPTVGASGTFGNGKQTITAVTDQDGVARSGSLLPNLMEGRFSIRITARQQDREGALLVSQSNTSAGVAAGHSNKKVWIILAVAVGGGVGAALALKGSGSSNSNTPVSTVLTGGPIVVGAPR
jgi:hypothetical protein